VRGGAAGLAFRAAALALLAALGLAGTVTAGQVCLAAGEIQRTAISRFFLGRISGEHEAEPQDRPRNQFYEHGTSLQQMSFGKSAMPAHMAQINSDRAAKGMRSADELAQRADQQRQTHWRRCVRGPSGNSESAAFQARLGSEAFATSGIATGTASVGA
jgi:hypothetical protein